MGNGQWALGNGRKQPGIGYQGSGIRDPASEAVGGVVHHAA